ncbi:MAG TPA: alpha-amylase family glycosyl hydrolase, partial [Stellaceae bacterium]|nr:alpha-amylase family glycosyl hydrolase [Stellaceae bacterium]
VDRRAARFAAWYEMFPRSQGTAPNRSATLQDCIARLDDIAGMGFDTIYLPPIHPIGRKNRKGRNNSLSAEPDEPGSPYAIGSADGGHDAVDPALGSLDDFRDFVAACASRGMEVALDLAVQCAPDHPWIAQHPDWFEFRGDGSIRYAENPPKQYQDIVNVNFRAPSSPALWKTIRDVVKFWIAQGVRVFRVDNPHTKPLPFWEWLIRDIQRERADILFLSEAFTRPKVMRNLAKLGFTQSYTYFTWRNEKQELIEYFTELTHEEAREYLRPHLFANTPDILPRFLQEGGPPAFRIRAVLAATLAGLFGIYSGFELCENRALPNSEEYADSEKYQYKVWDWDRPGNIKPLIAALNRIRRAHAAFEDWLNLEFFPCDNDRVLFYGRGGAAFIAVSLDPFAAQETVLDLPLHALGIAESDDLRIVNLLTGGAVHWVGARQRIRLDPETPALIFTVARTR